VFWTLIFLFRVTSLGFVQNFLWSNAGFGGLRDNPHLEPYDARYDPTVVPMSQSSNSGLASASYTTPDPKKQLAPELPGRYHSAYDLHALYTSGKLTPTAVVEALLPLIRRDANPQGKHSIAFLESRVDLIRGAAQASTQRFKDGKQLGVLDGIPVGIKDEVDIDGYKTRIGTLKDFTPENGGTSWCVKKWEEAGAIIMGKLTMHELGLGTSSKWSIHRY
jgi:amidase